MIINWLYLPIPLDNHQSSYINPDLEHLLGIDVKRMKRASALFLMKLKEVHRLPQTAIDDIVQGYLNIMTYQITWLRSAVHAKLSALAVEESICDDFFNNVDPFEGLHARVQQENYIQEEFNLVVSLTRDYNAHSQYNIICPLENVSILHIAVYCDICCFQS